VEVFGTVDEAVAEILVDNMGDRARDLVDRSAFKFATAGDFAGIGTALIFWRTFSAFSNLGFSSSSTFSCLGSACGLLSNFKLINPHNRYLLNENADTVFMIFLINE